MATTTRQAHRITLHVELRDGDAVVYLTTPTTEDNPTEIGWLPPVMAQIMGLKGLNHIAIKATSNVSHQAVKEADAFYEISLEDEMTRALRDQAINQAIIEIAMHPRRGEDED